MSAAARIVVWKDGARLEELSLVGEGYVGRESDCEIRLDDRAVSRRHAWFRVIEGGAIELRRKSEFGSLKVNGEELTEAILQPGGSMELGPFRVSLEAEPVQAETAEAPVIEAKAPEPIEISSGFPAPAETPAEQIQTAILEASTPDPDPMFSNESTRQIDSMTPDLSMAIELDSPAVERPSAPAPSIPEDDSATGDSTTRLIQTKRIDARLIFPQGTATPNVVEIGDQEIVIGRSRACTVVLSGKKCSRRNTVIKRDGAKFKITDLDSVNGTFVNGKKIKESELAGDDLIQIGEVSFHIRIIDSNYAEEAKNASYPAVPEEAAEQPPEGNAGLPFEWQPQEEQASPDGSPPMEWTPQVSVDGGPATNHGIPLTAGASASGKPKTLMERYRALPQWKQMIVGVIALAFVWWFLEDEPEMTVPAPQKANVAAVKPAGGNAQQAATDPGKPVPPSFERLPAEQKRFIETQHQLAFDLYRGKDYDKAVFEIRKIFALVPDYKDAKEIERYALEGKKKLEVLEEERRKKEEEIRIRTQVAEMEAKIRALMGKKKHDAAVKLFPEILALDPENQNVAKWQGEIEAFEIERREKEERRQLQLAINREAWELYGKALELFKASEYQAARKGFQKVLKRRPDDQKLLKLSEEKVAECWGIRQRELQVMLEDARSKESAGETSRAYALYEKISVEDPTHAVEAEAGMKRIQTGIDDRAKITYTEAVLAESFSDFETAKTRFKEIIQTTPENNLYYQRAKGKLARYQSFQREPSSDAPK